MEGYPDPEEEFELLHQEEMEAMLEMERQMTNYFNSKPKSKSSLNFDSEKLEISTDNSIKPNKTSYKVKRKRELSMDALNVLTSELEIERPTKKSKINKSNTVDYSHEIGVTSSRIPKWPFMPVSTDEGGRLYVKINYKNNDDLEFYNKKTNLLVTPYQKLKELAEKAQKQIIHADVNETFEEIEGHELWVNKYKPKTYFDLLSDEAVNRTLLNWLKLWDKIVFNKEKTKVKNIVEKENKFSFKKFDKDGRPFYKIALLCGPPGLGKTTLAHVVATLAGYNAVEVNASDDRTVEVFNAKLNAATQMKSVMGSCKPNCLILDEIDGAPVPTIDFLIKYLNCNVEKSKKGKKENQQNVVKRPVICICNELYSPSLRQLRQQAFVVHFPQTSSIKLAQRLLEICKKQDIKTDISTLTLLCDKAQNDIRSCLSTLHFFKIKNGQRFKSTDVIKSNVGQKDVQKGVFSMWKELFQVPFKKKGLFSSTISKGQEEEVSSCSNYSKKGMDQLQYIVQMFQSSGDYERLVQGVYENFLKSKFSGTFGSLTIGLEWFTWFDLVDSNIKKDQNFILMKYLPYSFAAWHFLFSTNSLWKISYPTICYENHVKEMRRIQILNDVLRGLDAGIRSYNQRNGVLMDILPMFGTILTPPLRPVNPTLFNDREKTDFKHLLDVMIDYNLNFIQQRSPDGTYFFQYDPNIEELTTFSEMMTNNARGFSYNMKQLISHEVELERLRRAEEKNSDETQQNSKTKMKKNIPEPKPIIPEIKPKEFKENEAQYKDFFGRVVKVKDTTGTSGAADKNNPVRSSIWFCYKEGYNNAVKKDITMKDLL